MSLIIPANTLASGGFSVDNSCRFDDGSSTQMNKTISSTSTTWTFSCWIKLNPTGTNQYLASWDMGGGEALGIGIEASTNQLFIYTSATGQAPKLYDGKLRDPSAWMNIVIKNSSGTITSYINGTQAKTSITGTALASGTLRIGCYTGSNYFYDGYMAEVVLIDGTAYSADSFGEFDSDSNIWKPINVSGLTFGSDGFYLDFKDSANLGNDANGGTDLTEVNLAAIDQTTDTPTNNFATMNPLWRYYISGDFSDGNLTIANNTSFKPTPPTIAPSSGKWYMEAKAISGTDTKWWFGIADQEYSDTFQNLSSGNYVYGVDPATSSVNERMQSVYNNILYVNGTSTVTGFFSSGGISAGDIAMLAVDLDNQKIWYGKNGVWNNGAGTESTTLDVSNPDSTSITSGRNYYINTGADDCGWSVNYGNPPYTISSGNTDGNDRGNFEYAVPSGYLSLCTANLSEVLG